MLYLCFRNYYCSVFCCKCKHISTTNKGKIPNNGRDYPSFAVGISPKRWPSNGFV